MLLCTGHYKNSCSVLQAPHALRNSKDFHINQYVRKDTQTSRNETAVTPGYIPTAVRPVYELSGTTRPLRDVWQQQRVCKVHMSCPFRKQEIIGLWSCPRYTPWWRLGEEEVYSCYSFLTSTLDGVSGQHHALAALYPPGKSPRYPLYRRLGGPQSRSGRRD
jgi:hypothetical protein